jgi:hypothetical protein
MTDNHTEMVVAALRVAIAQRHPDEGAREHEIRLANALRGVLEARAVPYSEELYPEAVRSLVPGVAAAMPVVLDPTTEPDRTQQARAIARELADALAPAEQEEPAPPELNQTELANDLAESLGTYLANQVVPQVSHWLESRDLALVFYPEEGKWIGQRPVGSITPKAKAELNLRAELTSSISEAIGPLEFRRGFRKNLGPTYRVY